MAVSVASVMLAAQVVAAETADLGSLSASRRKLNAVSDSTVGIDVLRGENTEQVVITSQNQTPSFTVSKLSNPTRLVIDLKSEKVKATKQWPIADLESVSGIRLGTQPSAARVVLDLTEGTEISHNVTTTAGQVVVSLRTGTTSSVVAPSAGAAKLPEVSPSKKVAPVVAREEKLPVKAEPQLPEIDDEEELVAEPELLEKPAAPAVVLAAISDKDSTKKKAPEVIIERSKPVEAAPAPKVEAPVVLTSLDKGGVAHIKNVKLLSGQGAQTSVSVALKGVPEYSIARTAPSEYVLTLKNTTVADDALSSALFSQSQTSGIRSVRAIAHGKDALIRIFAQPQVFLTARNDGETVVVEETKDLKQVVDDMRAQLAPAATEPDAKKTTAAEPKPQVSEKKAETPQKKDNVAAKAEKSPPKENADEMSDTEVQALLGDTAKYTGKLISLDLQDTDIDNALRIIAEVSGLNVVASEDVIGKVTLRLTDVPWDQALDVILKTHGLDKVLEGNVMRIAPIDKLRVERESLKQAQVAQAELEPLTVKYLRVSYGRAAELKALVETVLSERGTVAYDERSNQLIVKDIEKGISNVTELVSKVDLRTPQVLLETQIVEASRNLSRELGSELGFQYIQSPATGNGTGLNFPAAISVGGSAIPGTAANITGAAFPVASSAVGGSAVTMLFDSADGTKTLELRLSQLEQEGRVRIVSRPAVATTNNKAAEIKSVERYRVKLPNGGTSVATGSGATAAGSGSVATEVIEAGIVLNVTPQASPDYYILLDIKAKSSSFGSKSVDGIPNEIERSASSSVLVSSGQTFALGGIYKINEADRLTGVPFFKDIPFFGTFFRRSQTENSDEELLFFITPRIVEGSFDDATMKTAL
jgi:type IV pilus assembly protein PilQ